MGRYIGPQCRLCRAEGRKLFLKGERCYTPKCAMTKNRPKPGKAQYARMRKPSNYAIQLREKQKLKRLYNMSEAQFRRFFHMAEKMPGRTGDNLIILLERRLDNIVYRMHFASSRKQARQIVDHGHVLVNGRKVNIPSYIVREGDRVEIREKSKKLLVFKESLKEYTRSGVMAWLEVDPDNLVGTVKMIPMRSDITDLADIKENLIVELYSK
ncbi:ribosomal protein S4 [Spirochaeta thermophila DSM 6578]|uniref:Small ribosomal subunit protein uS4 n=1 Tax=Winmispira thermophila (strain ATCC 700085 / DSM 6578 / Z-1203) TaxID=869211 RepID=G0G9S2_WINT7|nr:30S ribosomal protein S4 [Spirochaeta thermophila]AEJ60822.1 ribosomal protein S4 [Spirochaeta thermophila DSM 6578]